MWFGKNIIAKLGLVLAVAVPAFAADVKDMYPLKFSSLSDELQAQYWNDLMSFKMWGTDEIIFAKVTLPDKVGALGTTGDFNWFGAGKILGGPIYVNGNITSKGGEQRFTSGPCRVNGDLKLDGGLAQDTLIGVYCVNGEVNDVTKAACKNAKNKGYQCDLVVRSEVGDEEFENGICAKIKAVPENLFIPSYPFSTHDGANVLDEVNVVKTQVYEENANAGEYFIDIPPIQYDDDGNITKKMYDYVLSSLTLGQESKLFIRIGSLQSLARFFVNGAITLNESAVIQVVLVDGDWDKNKKRWVWKKDSDTTHVPQSDYAGNLLFYTTDDFYLPAMHGNALLEGTFISTKTIKIGSNLQLAGQFLAQKIDLSQANDLDGTGFRYVPFNAPVITASGTDNIIEEGRDDNVNIVLDKTPSTDITFEYCYYFEGTKNSETDKAIAADVEYVVVNNAHASVPIYDPSTYDPTTNLCSGLKPLKSSFKEGSQKLTTPIILHAYADGVVENEYEEFKIWILNLEGAVLETGKHEGPITLKIHDIDGKPKGADITVAGTEDVPYKFDVFNVTNAAGSAVITDYFVKIESLPTAGSLVLIDDKGKSVPVKAKDKISSADIAAGNFVFKFDPDDYTEGPTPDPSKDIERYNFEFRVVDARNNAESKSSYNVLVTVDPVNDAPVASKTVFTIPEKSESTTLLKTYATSEASDGAFDASDVDDPKDVLTYKFDDNFGTGYTEENYNHVTSLYGIEETSGKIYVKAGAKLDYESADSVLTIRVVITDKSTSTGNIADAQSTVVEAVLKITDVNEPPTVDNPTFTIPENLGENELVGEVEGKDPDSLNQHGFEHLEYFIDPANTVANAAFKIVDPTKGNITVKDSTYLDYETVTDHKFVFDVLVRNCEYDATKKTYTANCLEDVRSHVTVELTDVPEPPIIIPKCQGDECPTTCQGDKCEVCQGESCNEQCVYNCDKPHDPVDVLTVSVNENSKKNYEVMRYLVHDEDLGNVNHANILKAEIKSAVAVAEKIFDAKMVKDDHDDWNVVVFVADSSELDYEKLDSDTILKVMIYVYEDEDGGLYGSLPRVIKVKNVNEGPTITGAEIDLPENTPAGDTIKTLAVVDPDKVPEFRRLKYEIVEDPTNPVPFRMDSNNVVVTKTLNYEEDPLDYTFQVAVTDITDETLTDTAWVTIHLKNVNEKPTIIIDDGPDGRDDSDSNCVAHCGTTNRGVWKDSILTIGVRENVKNPDGSVKKILSPTDMVLFVYHYADEDTGDVARDVVTWYNVGTTIPSVSTKGTDLFKLDYSNGTITVSVKNETLLDYETLRNATSHNDPDPEYTIGIIVRDRVDETLADTLYRIIRVTDENEAPGFEAETCVIVEGRPKGDSVGRIMRPIDYDSLSRNPEFYNNKFEKTAGTDFFHIESDDGWLLKLVSDVELDCESEEYDCDHDGKYSVTLNYYDPRTSDVKHQGVVPVRLIDLNEEPVIETDSIKVKENSPAGTFIDTIAWSDVDRFDDVLHFEITKDPSGCFAIDKNTGAVTVKKDKCANLDFELNEYIEIFVSVTDMVNVTDTSRITGGPNTVEKKIKVNVIDVNEPPTIIEETFSVDEDAKKGSVVDTVKATDPDKDPKYNKHIFTAIGGDTATFKIDSITGIVTLKDTLDYETKSKYELVVRVYDGEYADTAIVPIYVNNKIEKTEVKITLYDDSTKVWHDPDTVFTNSPGREICWVQGRSDRDLKDTCMDVHITKDSVIVIRYKDPTTDTYGVDSLVIFYSNAAPIVTISGSTDDIVAENVFTIVEKTEQADTNLYVNERNKDVRVTVKDPASKTDTSFVVSLKLDAVNVPQKTLDVVNRISKENRFVLSGPKEGETRTPVNGNEVKISYREVLGKDTVMVSYMTDVSGDPVKVPVVDEKGNVDSVEVMTVSYNTIIDGKKVTVSFQVDAMTGEVLVKNSNGTLMVSGASKSASGSSNGNTGSSSSSSKTDDVTEGMFQITYSTKDVLGNSTTITYSVDEKGRMVKNAEGDTGYSVAYSYTNKYGNSATQSLFIVLDQVGPKVEILSPVKGQVIRSNFVSVTWTVNGVEQDTLTMQGLEKGPNVIVRFFRDKAGNEASDTVLVIMKDSKDVDIAVVTPVTEMDPETVREYYEEHPLEKGETFAVSIMNPSTGKEIETLKGGSFKTKKGSEEELYPGKDKKHLGPTLALDVKLPVVNAVGGLATMDDLVSSDGMVSLEGVDAKNSTKITVEKYAQEYCEEGFNVNGNLSQVNLYRSKMVVKIWVYTSLGSFVDYFSFTQDLNNPEYTNEAGMLKMFFEMKPDKDGFVKADNGKLYATGAYLYKVDAKILSSLRCTLPPVKDPSGKKKGDRMKSSDELLKPFGYQRPKTK